MKEYESHYLQIPFNRLMIPFRTLQIGARRRLRVLRGRRQRAQVVLRAAAAAAMRAVPGRGRGLPGRGGSDPGGPQAASEGAINPASAHDRWVVESAPEVCLFTSPLYQNYTKTFELANINYQY